MFGLSPCPVTYMAHYTESSTWEGTLVEHDHLSSRQDEEELPSTERENLFKARNTSTDIPLVSYSSQYAMSCFEGVKALPQVGGGYKLFRPSMNGDRFARSMSALLMPPFPCDLFVNMVHALTQRNFQLGFLPGWQDGWTENDYETASALYIRPYTASEGGLGIGVPKYPYVLATGSVVTSYVAPQSRVVTSSLTRAVKGGLGSYKVSSNYPVSILANAQARDDGYSDALFLDAEHHEYIEEGSASNFFAVIGGCLVTPPLSDTILPGVTRDSLIYLAHRSGIEVQERPISIAEVLDNATEAFMSGTATGVGPIYSITHGEKTATLGPTGEISALLKTKLKNVQYGVEKAPEGWLL